VPTPGSAGNDPLQPAQWLARQLRPKKLGLGPATGRVVLVTAYLEKRKESLSLAGARLLVLRGQDRGRALHLDKEEVCVGTASSCDLVVADETVSRHHLSLRTLTDAYLLTDLESTNGTFFYGRRIQSMHLQPGDSFDLGRTRIRLEAVGPVVELPLSRSPGFGRLLGRSADSRRLFARLEAVAAQDVTVLLVGETGTGKDVAARSLHEAGPRADKPFVVVDCSAIPSNLMEAELFGHERGAFTGAERRRRGALMEAHGGTLFLDEISKLPYDMQPKLLRALENREVRPLGADRPVAFDARVIAACGGDLRLEVNRGLFRDDLFYRLNIVTIRMPPLRERADDIPMLANHFYRELSRDPQAVLPASVVKSLLLRSWPGNVRELRNTVERWVALSELEEPELADDDQDEPSYATAKARALAAFERTFLTSLLVRANGNITHAARMAAMDRVTLLRLLRRHQIASRASAGSP
jgi:transcriptional regulator with AAA-type ATPase domain